MKLIILTILIAFVALASTGRIVCYFPSWTIYRTGDGQYAAKDVDPDLCTHVIYAYVGLNETGVVTILDDWDVTGLDEIKHLTSLKDKNPDLKVMVSMGGWSEGPSNYVVVAADATLRATLVDSVLSFLKKYEFDGLDVDWEFPGQGEGSGKDDAANFLTLLGELKTALNDEGYILSAVVSGRVDGIDVSFGNGEALSDNLDMINVKSYDYHGDWDKFVGQNAPLYESHLDKTSDQKLLNVAAGVQHLVDVGADPKKINIGIGTYGRTYVLEDESDDDLYAPTNGTADPGPYTAESGRLSYYEICSLYGDVEDIWDDEQKVPHKVIDNLWIGYDNEKSVKEKIDFANDLELGGAMIWSLDTDDFNGLCGTKYPLLTVIKENLN